MHLFSGRIKQWPTLSLLIFVLNIIYPSQMLSYTWVTGVITRRYHWIYNSTYACLKGPACRLLFAERHTPQLAPRLPPHAVVLSSRRRRQHGGWLTLWDVKGWPPGIHEHEIEIGRFINNLRQFPPKTKCWYINKMRCNTFFHNCFTNQNDS